MSEWLAPTMAGLVFGSTLVFAGLLWKLNRPWDIIYRVLFFFFGIFIMVGTMGFASEVFDESRLNSQTSPTIAFGNGQTFVAFYNTTGDLMVANSTTNGTSWTVNLAASQDEEPTGARDLSQTNLTNSIWIGYLAVVVFVALFIVEIVLWFKGLAEAAVGKNKRARMDERGEPD